METPLPLPLDHLLPRFDGPGVAAVVLMGSHARGEAGPQSDVDVVRLLDGSAADVPGAGSHLIDGHLVVVSDVTPAEAEAWFTRPEVAVKVIAGLRLARPLLDRDGAFAAIQQRAHAFTWDAAMQARADDWASEQMAGWAEEAHKGLEGLRRGDVGRLLNARHGMSWGLTRVMQVRRGILESGDNAFYDETARALTESADGTAGQEWVRLRTLAFGIGADGIGADGGTAHAPGLAEQVRAGLRLYVLTAQMLDSITRQRDRPLVDDTVRRIREALAADEGQEHPQSER